MTAPLVLAAQLAFAALAGAGLIGACRWLGRRSSLCASLVVAGVLVRAALALVLFWTSYLDLPFLRQQHTGDGFWKQAIDATTYYYLAIHSAERGIGSIVAGSPSPVFVEALALWMRAAGISPINGAYFNIAVYVVLCLAIVAIFRPVGRWRADLPCAVMLGAVSFSPVLLIYGTQPLKDTLFVCLIGLACVAAYVFLPSLTRKGGSVAAALGMSAVFVGAEYAFGGIRPYYGVLAWSALALVLFLYLWRQGRMRFVPYAAMCAVLLTAAWMSYTAGADIAYFNPYARVIDKAWIMAGRQPPVRPPPQTAPEAATTVVGMVDQYRVGFVATPGKTNVVPITKPTSSSTPPTAASPSPSPSSSPVPVPAPVTEAAPSSVAAAPPPPSPEAVLAIASEDRVSAIAIGLGLLFVPVSLLRALSIVDLTGGRALLAIADLDTVFTDLTILAGIALLVRRRWAIGDRLAYVLFTGALGVSAALLMAYIVTNFGTLFRLRLMAAAPFWMLPLALANRRAGAAATRAGQD